MKIRTVFLTIIACLIIMPTPARAQLVIDFNKQPEPKTEIHPHRGFHGRNPGQRLANHGFRYRDPG